MTEEKPRAKIGRMRTALLLTVLLLSHVSLAAPAADDKPKTRPLAPIEEVRARVTSLEKEVAALKAAIETLQIQLAELKNETRIAPKPGAPAVARERLMPWWAAKNDGPGKYRIIIGPQHWTFVDAKGLDDAVRKAKNLGVDLVKESDEEGQVRYLNIEKTDQDPPIR